MRQKCFIFILSLFFCSSVFGLQFQESLIIKAKQGIHSPLTFQSDNKSWQYINFTRQGKRDAYVGVNPDGDFIFGQDVKRSVLFMTERVGIATYSPATALHVVGQGARKNSGPQYQAYIQSLNNTASLRFLNQTNGGYIGYANIGSGNLSNVFFVTSGWSTIGEKGLILDYNGDVAIGTTDIAEHDGQPFKLTVDGGIWAKMVKVEETLAVNELTVQPSFWADYVFDPSYVLMPLDQLESLVKKQRRLPGIPSQQEVAAKGISVGDMQAKLLEKIEELTLYIIEQNKRIARLEEGTIQN